MLQQKHEVDVAKYARLEQNEQDITLTWEEFRDIFKVEVKCSDPAIFSDAKLQYWQHHWPHQRVPKGVPVGAGGSGWMAQDDWYNGEWKDADVSMAIEADKVIYTFNPVNAREFPDIEGFEADYRSALKIRIVFDGKKPEVEGIEAYSDSIWKESEVRIEWGDGFAGQGWTGRIAMG